MTGGSMTLHLEPDAIERCVRICDQMLDSISDALREASDLQYVDGFGDFRIGDQLAAGYTRKAGTVTKRLEEYETVILAMREAFAAGGEAFADADGQLTRALGSLDSGVDQ
ncbi:hypothetical protein [Rhodococcus spongiicola]|uniref:Uncharacterized protein n=1 Tax=Rhodococcus spongiicola TaxID=2487352 RepID=A0A438AXE3_9NOCA|nr:hypothetical protein [Rhodococcus spongiicola]RVW03363.1 hypothetical protein EF834_09470 [Rhodococcus spongiicola]